MSRFKVVRRFAAAIGLSLVAFSDGIAGYDLSISSSNTDPDENTSESPIGLDSLFIWVKCAEEGISAMQADIEGNITVLGFTPRPGVLNAGTSTSLLLGIADCPTGDEINMILGSITVWDSSSAGGRLSLVESSPQDWPVVTSCGDGDPIIFIPRVMGFASDGDPADETGAEYGCGYFPESPAAQPSGSPPYEWSDDYGTPPSGKGTDDEVSVVRRMASQSNALIVAGKFDNAGNISPRGFAKLVTTISGGSVTTSWSLPSNWGNVTALGSGEKYWGADSDANGGIALGSSNFNRAFVYCPSSGSCIETTPAPSGADQSMVFDVEHWSENSRYLVGGWFYDSNAPPSQGEYHGLAQFNTSTSSWENFGYPTIGGRYWVEPDGFGSGWVGEIFELNLPGLALDHAVVIGGDFGWVFGVSNNGSESLTVGAEYVAWLNPDDWRFYDVPNNLAGEPHAFAHLDTVQTTEEPISTQAETSGSTLANPA